MVTDLGEPENNSLSALIQHPTPGSPATHRGEDDVGMAVTGRVPPRDTLTGDPETRFLFDLCREMLAPETAGDGRSVNARALISSPYLATS